ncbi:FecR family protein [Mucilaginibacter jinjuensis]|uniref:DUF4974 domain-containing protein n=1 Tax=Mucilaginibacter jinjuensis TaxID=1176721 RepID=A0ABY7T616_9SPHI|nr:FecR family protein [Mucilaginibacter jinjuensis]WCT10702.1 DUF4974 domain-containing protein [Mucilaginibacter jinjuensis]
MEQQILKALIAKYNAGTANAEEKALVEQWYENIHGDEYASGEEQLNQIKQRAYRELYNYINNTRPSAPAKIKKLPFRWLAAAVLLLVGSIGIYYHYKTSSTEQVVKNNLKNDIAPGGNKAILKLADGSNLVLDDAKNGQVAKQGEVLVEKKHSGLLSYLTNNTTPGIAAVTYNTITTPRGGQYNVILADGTQVWLNAASSLKFPTSFTGKERNVELTGEAYFEVAKNKTMPFHVTTVGQTIEVLGTHFNVNAYADEAAIKTTLLEGSVKVSGGNAQAIIKPGEQASLNVSVVNPAITVTDGIDTDEVMAWKNGSFYFNNADIQTVMRQISRWYNVDIEYAGKIPEDHFTGKFSRNMTASNALKVLEFTGVNFKIEGRKIIVK